MKGTRTQINGAETQIRPNALDVRLANWGRWSRRSASSPNRRWFNSAAPDDADALRIERAVARMQGTLHAQLLRSWHQALAHQSRIAVLLGIPRRTLGRSYREARSALASALQSLDQEQAQA